MKRVKWTKCSDDIISKYLDKRLSVKFATEVAKELKDSCNLYVTPAKVQSRIVQLRDKRRKALKEASTILKEIDSMEEDDYNTVPPKPLPKLEKRTIRLVHLIQAITVMLVLISLAVYYA